MDRQKWSGSNGGPGTSRDIEMMKNPLNWPRWPWLPLKRCTRPEDGQWDEFGVIYADVDDRPIVVTILFNNDLSDKKCKYDSFEAVAADGWHVD